MVTSKISHAEQSSVGPSASSLSRAKKVVYELVACGRLERQHDGEFVTAVLVKRKDLLVQLQRLCIKYKVCCKDTSPKGKQNAIRSSLNQVFNLGARQKAGIYGVGSTLTFHDPICVQRFDTILSAFQQQRPTLGLNGLGFSVLPKCSRGKGFPDILEKVVAFMEGTHERLGEGSRVKSLPAVLVQMIVLLAFPSFAKVLS